MSVTVERGESEAAPQADSAAHAVTRPRAAFAREAQMLPIIAAAADVLCAGLAGEVDVFFEVPLAAGVPDVVLVAFDSAAVQSRLRAGLGPVVDVSCVRTLVALAGGTTDTRELAGAVGLTVAHLRRRVVPRLAAAGWVRSLDAGVGEVQIRHTFRSVVAWSVTVEAKRRAWAQAVAQASRHTAAADRAFVALDLLHARPAFARVDHLASSGVGLAAVSATEPGAVDVLAYPRADRPRLPRRHRGPDAAAKSLLGERVWAMRLEGSRHGQTYPVFGRDLSFQ